MCSAGTSYPITPPASDSEACDHSEWAPACPFCGESAIPLFDTDVIAIVEALAAYDREGGRATRLMFGEGATLLPALRPILERYKEIKQAR